MTASDDGSDPWIPRKRRRLQSTDAQTPSPGSPPTLDPGIRTRCALPSWDQDAENRDYPWPTLEYPIASQYCFGMVWSPISIVLNNYSITDCLPFSFPIFLSNLREQRRPASIQSLYQWFLSILMNSLPLLTEIQ